MSRFPLLGVLSLVVFLLPPLCPQGITTVRVAAGLNLPLYACSPPGDTSRLFILEQHTARIMILKNGALLPSPFLDLPSTVVASSSSERGLLGLAFHPDYANNGYFYLNYNNPAGTTIIARYQVSAANPDVADPGSVQVLLSIAQPYSNHNGGMMAFGPDGFLYIGTGDGGSFGDPQNNGQSTNTLLGKLLRIDVDTPAGGLLYSSPTSNPFSGPTAGLDEIYAIGLRNPWRFSFDRVTSDLYIADVGQDAREEIDFKAAAAQPSPGNALNYGWRCREGTATYNTLGCPPSGFTNPIYEYLHSPSTGYSVTGGYVYRGCAIPGLEGAYFFGDYVTGKIWSFRYDGVTLTQLTDRTAQLAPGGGLSIASISSFGEDAQGELYICDHLGGEVFKIIPSVANPGAPTLSLGGLPQVGTTLPLNLSSPLDPNRGYIYAFALSSQPGMVLPDNRSIPLNPDAIFYLSLDPLSTIFLNNFGTLDGSGAAAVQVAIPPLASLVGVSLYTAFIALEPTASAGVSGISCAVPITLQ